MKVCFHAHAWADYVYWQEHDRRLLARSNELIRAIQRDPFKGIGKPEPLRGSWTGFWSRRIDRQQRLVYRVEGEMVQIAQCRFHY